MMRARLFAAREELKQITTQSEREGSLTATERAMIHNVFDFRSVKVRDVMVPLAEVVAVQPDTPVADALQLSDAAGIERLPVITREGKALGLVNALDISTKSIGNQYMADQLSIVTARVKEGVSFAGALEARGVFPEVAVKMAEVGEATGALQTRDEFQLYFIDEHRSDAVPITQVE